MSGCRCGSSCGCGGAPGPGGAGSNGNSVLASIIDCSDEGIERLRQQLQAMLDRRYSLINSVSDRSRSVSYAREEIGPLINELMAKIYFCETGFWPTSPGWRVMQPTYMKGL